MADPSSNPGIPSTDTGAGGVSQAQLLNQLDGAKRRAATLVEKNRTLEYQLETAARNNRRMVDLLEATRQEITVLKAALELDGRHPSATPPCWR